MKAYPKYKDSNIDWVGKIPAEWNLGKVSSHVNLINGFPFNSDLFSQENGVPLIRIRDITTGKTETFYSGDYPPESIIDNNDILIGMDGDFLARWWAGGKGVLNQRCCCLRPLASVNKRFLFYILQYPLNIINDLTYFTTVKHLSSGDIKGIKFPFPSLPEQQAIADFLDRKTAQIDTLIEKKQRQIELLQEQRTALINHAVTKGLNPNVEMKDSGVEWLGEIPSHWEVVKIKNMAKIMRGQFSHRPRNDPAYYDGAYPFVQTGDVTSADKYITTYQQTLNELGYSVSKEFPKDTIVMTIAANIGDVAILDFKSCFPDSMVGIVPFDNVSANYMYYNMKALKQEFIKISSINTQMNINVDKIENQISVKPPIREQEEIANHLDDMLKKTKLISEQITSQINLLQEYRTALISEAVTGKIDVR